MSQNKTKNNILVVGLGLIGSSLSQSLIRSKKVGKVYGYDKDKEVISYAKEKKFINEEVNNLRDGIIESDIIIFSVPVSQIDSCLDEAKNFFNTEKVFSDTLSSKKLILDYFKVNNLKNISNFIFSHPMAGTENFGIKYSKHDLFLNSTSIICPMENSNLEFVEIIKSIWSYVGCNIFEMDVRSHDNILSAVSHAPHFISFALAKKINDMKYIENNPWILDKGSLSDMARIAKSDPQAWANIFLSNEKNILEFIDDYIGELNLLKSKINSNDIEDIILFLKECNPKN
ncbi:MAG: prephenate dehydrogenase/arogenate dehydrogenase family protein [Pseudomonadota bacterium]|nr:prephenate dehydrogenase/arogenate dehydrogenase family protein [Pseudomonadota bacterium]|tara:strand:- start:231 stop:1091 length:861 start_codon:yes stop_codon:yes gene_type:complete